MTKSNLRAALIAVVMCSAVIFLAFLPRIFPSQFQREETRTHISEGNDYPLTVHDVTGRSITVSQKPQRILSLSPAVTEILFAIGAGDRVIANTTYCDYPDAAKKLPKVGGYLDPNVEKVMSLHPDLIIGARGTEREILEQLHQQGQTIVVVDPQSMKGTIETIRLVGRLVDASSEATLLANLFERRQQAVSEKISAVKKLARPRVLFLFSSTGGVFTVGPGSHIDEMIRLAGGENIAGDAKTAWPQIAMEKVVQADPEVILLMKSHGAQGVTTPEKALAVFRRDPQWCNLTAVKAGRVELLGDDEVTLPGPRLIDGLEEIASALHPGLFAREVAE